MHITFRKLLIFLIISFFLTSCGGFFKYSPARENPTKGEARAKKNVEEGRGVTLGGLARGRGNTNYEFSTSNPMWRASLEILDFLPMTTVDYSGGIIISDWYSDNSSGNQDSIKITIRFLSNEIRSDSLKIIIHKKKCTTQQTCAVNILSNSTIGQELRTSIIKKASLLQIDSKNKKKN
tara:strand:- start:51 stop:587 length:537 start_codon:yes stop_codon:yes gene_type:complete